MSQSCIVLIAATDLLPSLKKRAEDVADEVLTFTDRDALRALEVITRRKPAIVALERMFAATPRGAALINRIKADPSLLGSEVRVVSHDDGLVWPLHDSKIVSRNGGASALVDAPATATPQPLDRRGTRRATRFRLTGEPGVLVDGNQATLVNLSTIGAQLMSPTILKPSQRIRMALYDTEGTIRFNAAVAWASFEIPPRYRAGIEFIDADAATVDAYCARHKA